MSRDADIVTVAGVELCIRNSGADRVLFMLHGIGSNYSSFDQLSNELPSSIKLIAWNAPGYGGSTPLSSAHPVALDYAKKLNEVIEKLALEKIVLVGHSLGTLIATQFAHHFPEKIDALILMSCAEGYATPENDALPVNAQQRLDDLADKGPRIFAQERAPRLIHQPQHKPKLVEAAIDAMAAIHPHGYAQAVHMLSAGKLSQVAGDTSVRSLTIAGIEDQITPARQSRTCHDALISANSNINHELVEIPDAGHLVHQEQSAKVANSIQNFIRWGLIDASEADGMSTNKNTFGVPPVERAFQLLHYIGEGNSCSNISQASKESGINRTTMLRLLETLNQQRMIELDGKGGYILGTGLIHLASKAVQSRDVVTASQTELKRLAGVLGLSAHLGIATGVDILYLLRESPDLHLVSNVRVGSRLPIHATTIGRIILAFTDEADRDELLKNIDLFPVTQNTATTVKQFRSQLDTDKQQGFAWSEGFYEPAIGSAAVAIFDATQSVVAAINVTGPVNEFTDTANRHHEILSELRIAAQNISMQLGFIPSVKQTYCEPEAYSE